MLDVWDWTGCEYLFYFILWPVCIQCCDVFALHSTFFFFFLWDSCQFCSRHHAWLLKQALKRLFLLTPFWGEYKAFISFLRLLCYLLCIFPNKLTTFSILIFFVSCQHQTNSRFGLCLHFVKISCEKWKCFPIFFLWKQKHKLWHFKHTRP